MQWLIPDPEVLSTGGGSHASRACDGNCFLLANPGFLPHGQSQLSLSLISKAKVLVPDTCWHPHTVAHSTDTLWIVSILTASQ